MAGLNKLYSRRASVCASGLGVMHVLVPVAKPILRWALQAGKVSLLCLRCALAFGKTPDHLLPVLNWQARR